MPVTAGPVPGMTSNLRRMPMDPGRFHSGRWFLLAEGLLVCAFGVAGLVSAALHPHAGPTGAPVLGLSSTPAHSAMLVAFGLVAIAAVGVRRAAVTVTALSAVAYMMLLFFSSVGAARAKPTPLGFHAADIVLHGVLAVVNLALLMWLIPDELGDETWVPRRRGRGTGGSQSTARAEQSGDDQSPREDQGPRPHREERAQPSEPRSADPAVDARPPQSSVVEPSRSRDTHKATAHDNDNSTRTKDLAAPATHSVLPRGVALGAVAVLAAVVALLIRLRRR